MKILAFGTSNSSQSINQMLARHACDVLTAEIAPQADVTLLDLNDLEMPIYRMDREQADGIPDLAHRFASHIAEADALIISFAEHNGAYTAAYKNIYDWASRIGPKVYQNTPMLILSASPGPRGGANVLKLATGAAPRMGGDVRASFSVGPFSEVFDKQAGRLTDPELAATLRDALTALIK